MSLQRWSPRGCPWPRGHILKSLASKPQVLENCPVFGSRTALFFEMLKFCRSPEKFFEAFFFEKHLRLCSWSLALASSIPVLGLEVVCPWMVYPWPWPRIFFVSLASSLPPVPSTRPLCSWCLVFNFSLFTQETAKKTMQLSSLLPPHQASTNLHCTKETMQ